MINQAAIASRFSACLRAEVVSPPSIRAISEIRSSFSILDKRERVLPSLLNSLFTE